jgi:predicted permease
MGSFRQDLVYAVRTLGRSPGYTAAALLSLALGIGANTAIFTLTDAVFLNPLPVKDASRVLELYTVDHATRTTLTILARTPVSWPNLIDIREQSNAFTGLAGFVPAGATLTGFGKPSIENLTLATPNYFEVLGVSAVAGRTFQAEDDFRPTAVLSYTMAQRLFGNARAALGRTVNLNATSWEVIGVAPPEFRGTFTVGPPDVVWLPLSMHRYIFAGLIEQLFNERRFRFINVFGRLKPGVDEREAQAGLRTIAARLEAAYPRDNRGRTIDVSSLTEAALGFLPRNQTRAAAFALTAAVGFVLLIACANIANLTLARATRRMREMGIRVALGASRGRLIRQLLTEAEVLAIAGGALGICLGALGARLLWKFRPDGFQQNDIQLRLDLRVLAFTAGVSLLTGILFGLAPVFRASLPDVAGLLNSAGRGNIGGGGRHRLRRVLVVAEMALALVALAGAGLFIRSMQKAQQIDPGFETSRLCVVGFNLGAQKMTPERGLQFMRTVMEKVRATPGVAAVAVAASRPLGGNALLTAFREGDAIDSRLGTLTATVPVSPGYFDTMRIPMVSGRVFSVDDRAGSRPVAVITETMAHLMWPGQTAIGKRFRFATSPVMYEVVGIVRNIAMFTIGEPPQPVAFLPVDQDYQPGEVLHVRTSTNPERVLPSILAAVQSQDPDLALLNANTMHEIIGQALWAPRMAAGLFGIFGLLGMALAVIGVYGVMAYMVLQRTSEIGIRMAMGAPSAGVLRMFVLESLRLAALGIAGGLCVALALTRLLGNLLFDVSPTDPLTFATVSLILAATGLLAGLIPAWRAARIDPVRALREA